jgi:rSAM/selenodomain-associated transferase 2
VISVIVPVLNEAGVLAASLADLLAQPGDFEVIVVDGGSRDRSGELASAFAGVRVVHAQRGRALQMNAGAALARGELLLFLHADTRLPAGAIVALDAAQAGAAWQAGAFRHRFAPADWRLRIVSAVNNLRCRWSRIYFGDQAIFVRRELFERLGGFPAVPMLEDVIFCERLRRVTCAVLLRDAVMTDARRFLRHGVWRTSLRALLILARHRLGLPPGGHGFADEVR